MGRLIDADAFKMQVSAMVVKLNWSTTKATSFLKIIDSQPTAYDIDSVINQIADDKKHTLCGRIDKYEAIEIVKGGNYENR